jgi:hypothetical protein
MYIASLDGLSYEIHSVGKTQDECKQNMVKGFLKYVESYGHTVEEWVEGCRESLNDYNNDVWTEQVIMDTDDITTATKVWRWNLGGLGYSPNGYNGAYTTAITQAGEIVADFITAGTLDASKITVTNLDAGAITTGTLDASNITVTNLNADNITAGSISANLIEDRSLSGTKIKLGGITGGVSSGGQPLGELGLSTISGGNIGSNTISGGSSGNLGLSTITTANTIAGINTSLGFADFSNLVFSNGTRCGYMYCNYLDVNVTGRIDALSTTGLSVYYNGSYYSATFQQPSVTLNMASAFQVKDINGDTRWVSNVGSANLASFVLTH